MSDRRPCPNPKCVQLNKIGARFCARCGYPLPTAEFGVEDPAQGGPHWVFVAVFVAFFAFALVPIATSIGPISFIFIPFVLIGLRKVAKHRQRRRYMRWNQSSFTERLR